MDAFEQLVSEILWMEGYWVRTSVKVELSKAEKREIGRPSSPRWELDIVAYSGRDNLLRVIECKSYLDSRGVAVAGFINPKPDAASRYKLFNEPELRRVVLDRLCRQFVDSGACGETPKVRLGLACGKITSEEDRNAIRAHFDAQGWDLLDEPWLREKLRRMADGGYENQVSAVVAKLLLRGHVE
jgi:hypothetical protein